MKHRKNHSHLRVIRSQQPLYPNAADDQYFVRKIVDAVTGLVSCMGFVAAMFFLATMA